MKRSTFLEEEGGIKRRKRCVTEAKANKRDK
jgi:hypothetical protein